MKKRYFVIALVLLFGILAFLIITGIRSAQDNTDALAGTEYPVSYTFKDGKVTIKLDGHRTPELKWQVTTSNPGFVDIAQKGKERKGKVTYIISPKAEGTTRVSFVRETVIAGTEVDVATIAVPIYVTQNGGRLSVSFLQNPYLIMGPEIIGSDTNYPVIINSDIDESKPKDGENGSDPELSGNLIFPKGINDWTLSNSEGQVKNNITTASDGSVSMFLENAATGTNDKNFDLTLSSESLGITERLNVIFRDDGKIKITRILSK